MVDFWEKCSPSVSKWVVFFPRCSAVQDTAGGVRAQIENKPGDNSAHLNLSFLNTSSYVDERRRRARRLTSHTVTCSFLCQNNFHLALHPHPPSMPSFSWDHCIPPPPPLRGCCSCIDNRAASRWAVALRWHRLLVLSK